MDLGFVRDVIEEMEEVGNIIEFFKNIVFIIMYIYVFIKDMRHNMVDIQVFIIYGAIGILLLIVDYKNINVEFIINTMYSVCFGGMILLFSYLSRESIGKGDSIFFITNGLYMCLSENVMLFLTGLMVASIYGFYKYIKYRFVSYDLYATRVPFMPCLLPMVIWRVICLL